MPRRKKATTPFLPVNPEETTAPAESAKVEPAPSSAPAPTPAPKAKQYAALVRLLKGTQITDPGTGVILRSGQSIPVPEVSRWVKMQAGFGLLEIIEI